MDIKDYKTLFRNGIIAPWYLRESQLRLYDMLQKHKKVVVNTHRRWGKCEKEGTLIATPTGSIKIEKIKIGDLVYGYEDGKISLVKVKDVIYQGEKEVVDLTWSDQVWSSCTEQHRWLCYDRQNKKDRLLQVKDVYQGISYRVESIIIPGGDKAIKEAYSLGVLTGDGACRSSVINISSNDECIIKKAASCLGNKKYKKNSVHNYNWTILGVLKKEIPYYSDWLKMRYAHQKISDINEIRTWDRNSQLEYIAGILDTDGCVQTAEGRLIIEIAMQAKSVIDTVRLLFIDLFNIEPRIYEDNRAKYKNGSVFMLRIGINKYSKKILKELSGHLCCDRKKWKDEYNNLSDRNTYEKSIGLKKSKPYVARCWDIEIDNNSHLYLLANGMISHNSSTVFTHIFEQSLRNKITSRCGGQTQKAFFDIYNTMEEEIFSKCEMFKPKWSADEGCYKYPLTGAKTHLFGVSDKAEADKGRGAKAEIIYCDEYGFWSYKARYMLTSVLGPQLDTTDGQIIITSTPPEDLTHDYIEQINEAIRGGYYFYWNLNDSLKSGEVTPQMHEKIILRCGGMDTDAYKREYLCQLIAPSNRLVIPEAADKKFVVKECTRPECYDAYAGFDLGLKDFTACAFGFFDFKRGVMVIEDELMLNYKTTEDIVSAARVIESQLGYKNINRVSDSEMQQIFDMNNTYKYRVRAVVKRTEEQGMSYKESLLNSLRIAFKQGKIEVHEKCRNTINQVCYGIWKDNRQDFVRTEELGHLDSLMALAYLWDYIDKRKNPYPSLEEAMRAEAAKPDVQINWRTRVNNGIKDFMERKHKGITKF